MRVVSQRRVQKNALESNFKDESFPLRGTTLLHPCLTTGALWSTAILLRADGRTRRSLYGIPFRSQPRRSETIFRRTFRTRSHHTGLSVPYLPAYSSLPRVCRAYSVPLGLCLVYNQQAPSVNRASCTKREDRQTSQFAYPADFYMAPGVRLSRFTCRLASFRPLRRLFLVRRRSEPTAVWVPMDWMICTRMTSTITAP